MALLIEKKGKTVCLKVSMEEEERMGSAKHFLIIPDEPDSHQGLLTTGKIGNSFRIMVPKRLLRAWDVEVMNKKAPFQMIKKGENVYLVVKIKGTVPIYEEG